MTSPRVRAMAALAALSIVAGGALLRLDSYVGRYGTLDHPIWARGATEHAARLGRALAPSGVRWDRGPADPYVGGDPVNYLAYAREMESLYQPHVREPVFLALVRFSLWTLDDQDAGISLASTIGSLAAILGTYLLGAALGSRVAGLGAALLFAIDYDAIRWAGDGWRDDTFTATVTLAAWALVRLHQQPTFRWALAAGGLCGLACLTRITALSFVVPALLWVAARQLRDTRRQGLQYVAAAAVVAAALVLPFLLSNAIATGDPLYAVNYHTVYYRAAEGQDISAPMSAGEYLRTKFALRPVGTIETAFQGLLIQPFFTKWVGLEPWAAALAPALRAISAAGVVLLGFSRAGRLVLVILFTSLVPYAFTWNVGGGGEWRFTMHAYPFYLVAATTLLAEAVRGAWRLWMAPVRAPLMRALAVRTGAVAIVLVVVNEIDTGLPWFVVREALAAGEATSIETGPRDEAFYRDGWSEPRREGVVFRATTDERGSIYFPLPDQRPYDIVVRLDPVVPGLQQHFDALVNGRLLARSDLEFDPQRVGSYRFSVPPDLVRSGENELELIPDRLVRAEAAGDRFAWLDPGARVGLRVWYIRVLPPGQ